MARHPAHVVQLPKSGKRPRARALLARLRAVRIQTRSAHDAVWLPDATDRAGAGTREEIVAPNRLTNPCDRRSWRRRSHHLSHDHQIDDSPQRTERQREYRQRLDEESRDAFLRRGPVSDEIHDTSHDPREAERR